MAAGSPQTAPSMMISCFHSTERFQDKAVNRLIATLSMGSFFCTLTVIVVKLISGLAFGSNVQCPDSQYTRQGETGIAFWFGLLAMLSSITSVVFFTHLQLTGKTLRPGKNKIRYLIGFVLLFLTTTGAALGFFITLGECDFSNQRWIFTKPTYVSLYGTPFVLNLICMIGFGVRCILRAKVVTCCSSSKPAANPVSHDQQTELVVSCRGLPVSIVSSGASPLVLANLFVFGGSLAAGVIIPILPWHTALDFFSAGCSIWCTWSWYHCCHQEEEEEEEESSDEGTNNDDAEMEEEEGHNNNASPSPNDQQEASSRKDDSSSFLVAVNQGDLTLGDILHFFVLPQTPGLLVSLISWAERIHTFRSTYQDDSSFSTFLVGTTIGVCIIPWFLLVLFLSIMVLRAACGQILLKGKPGQQQQQSEFPPQTFGTTNNSALTTVHHDATTFSGAHANEPVVGVVVITPTTFPTSTTTSQSLPPLGYSNSQPEQGQQLREEAKQQPCYVEVEVGEDHDFDDSSHDEVREVK